MRSTIFAVGLLALGVTAIPSKRDRWGHWGDDGYHSNGEFKCMNDQEAGQVANNYADLISAYTNSLAASVLDPGVQDFTDSVIELIDGGCPSSSAANFIPLGSVTFPNLAAFEAGQGGQPNLTFNVIKYWHNCDTVTVRWRIPTPNPGPVPPPPAVQEEVTGMTLLETTYNATDYAQPYQIKTIYAEFNSGAWLYDLGLFTPPKC